MQSNINVVQRGLENGDKSNYNLPRLHQVIETNQNFYLPSVNNMLSGKIIVENNQSQPESESESESKYQQTFQLEPYQHIRHVPNILLSTDHESINNFFSSKVSQVTKNARTQVTKTIEKSRIAVKQKYFTPDNGFIVLENFVSKQKSTYNLNKSKLTEYNYMIFQDSNAKKPVDIRYLKKFVSFVKLIFLSRLFMPERIDQGTKTIIKIACEENKFIERCKEEILKLLSNECPGININTIEFCNNEVVSETIYKINLKHTIIQTNGKSKNYFHIVFFPELSKTFAYIICKKFSTKSNVNNNNNNNNNY